MEPITLFSLGVCTGVSLFSFWDVNHQKDFDEKKSSFWEIVLEYSSLLKPKKLPALFPRLLKPNLPAMPVEKPENKFLREAQEIARLHLDNESFCVSDLAKALNLSRSQAFRRIKEITGYSPSIFLRRIRLEEAQRKLQFTDLTISEIAYEVGFKDVAYFSRCFSNEYGKSPSKMRGFLKNIK